MLKTTNTRTKHTQIISKGWLVYINIFLVHLAMYVPPDVLKVHQDKQQIKWSQDSPLS